MGLLSLYADNGTRPDGEPEFDLPARASLTLREYYQSEILPRRNRRVTDSTIAIERNSIGRWEQFGGAWARDWSRNRFDFWEWQYRRDHSGTLRWIENPPIGLVADEDLDKFVKRMADNEFSAASVDQSIRVLGMIFRHAGPRGESNRGNDVLVRRPVFPQLLPVPVEKRRFLSIDEINALFETAKTIDRISQRIPMFDLSELARALIVFEVNYGLRPDDLVELKWGDNISEDATTLKFCCKKTKRHRPYEVVMPINPVTQNALLRLRRLRRHVDEVFYAPSQKRQLTRLWRAIVERSGVEITHRTDMAGKKYQEPSLYSLRRFCGDSLNSAFPESGVGSWVLGHALPAVSRTTARYYSKVYEVPEFVREAIMNAPQPAAFLQPDSPADLRGPAWVTLPSPDGLEFL